MIYEHIPGLYESSELVYDLALAWRLVAYYLYRVGPSCLVLVWNISDLIAENRDGFVPPNTRHICLSHANKVHVTRSKRNRLMSSGYGSIKRPRRLTGSV